MNIMRLIKSLMSASFILLIVSCRHSTNPVDLQPETEFFLYAANFFKGEVYIVDLKTYAVVDTIFNLGDYVRALAITNDGQTLFAHSDQLYKIDLPAKTRSIVQPYGEVYVSPNNIIFLKAADGLYTIDPMTGATTLIDSVNIGRRVVFDVSSTKMIGFENHSQEQSRLVIYDYQTKVLQKTNPLTLQNESPVRLAWILPSPDGKQIYFTGKPLADRSSFGVYSLESQRIVFTRPIRSFGRLANFHDGHFIYVSDPGSGAGYFGTPYSGTITIIRAENFQVEDSISVVSVENLRYKHAPTFKIVIRNDKNIAYVTTFVEVILVVDLTERKIVKTIELSPQNTSIHDIVLGQKIK